MSDSVLVLRITATSLREKINQFIYDSCKNLLDQLDIQTHYMAAFQAHPDDWRLLTLFTVLLLGAAADIFFVSFIVAILATRPI